MNSILKTLCLRPHKNGLIFVHEIRRIAPVVYLNQVRQYNSQHRVVILPEIPKDSAETNPILCKYTSKTFPKFSETSERNCFFGLGKSLLEFEVEVLQFEERCMQGIMDFDELFGPIEAAKCQFEGVWSSVNLLLLVSDILESDRFRKMHDRAKRALSTRIDSRVIFDHLTRMRDSHLETPFLKPHEEQMVNRYLIELKHQGFEGVETKYEELHGNWLKKVSKTVKEFNYKMENNAQRYQHTIMNPQIVREFPMDLLKAMAHDSTQPSKGPWTVSLHPYIYKQFLAYCPDRQLRYGAYFANISRGSKSIDPHNATHIHVREIRQHKLDMAMCLGYKNYVEMSMDTKMADSVESVLALIKNLSGKAKQGQETELEEMQSYANSRAFEGDIDVFDIEYFRRKQRRTILGMSDEDLSEYFPLPKVLDGIFNLCSQLFDVEFSEVDCEGGWNPDVKLFAIRDLKSDQILGHFYLDAYLREEKGYAGGDHGWYIPLRSRSKIGPSLPLGAIVFSLPPPNVGKPSLLSFFEVKEVLNKFGMALQHILCENEYSDLGGRTALEWDVVDFVGEFMSQLIHNPQVIRSLSGHWSRNEPIQDEVVQHLCTTIKHHMAGYDLCEELFLADFDIAYHSDQSESYADVCENLRKQYLLLPQVDGDAAPLYYTDLIGGEKSAGKFSTIWSKMLAADAFSAIEEVPNYESENILDNPDVKAITKKFRSTFLATGSSRPSAETFRNFRGRDPSHDALLVSLGLKKVNQPHIRSPSAAGDDE